MSVSLAVEPGVMIVIKSEELSVFDQWANTGLAKVITKCVVVVSFVANEASEFVGIPKADAMVDMSVGRPVGSRVNVADDFGVRIHECRRFEHASLAILLIPKVNRYAMSVKKRGIYRVRRTRIAVRCRPRQ